jgi:uncharacterized protein with PQ loop repeat
VEVEMVVEHLVALVVFLPQLCRGLQTRVLHGLYFIFFVVGFTWLIGFVYEADFTTGYKAFSLDRIK